MKECVHNASFEEKKGREGRKGRRRYRMIKVRL